MRDPLCSHVLRPQDGGEADHLIKCVMMQIITRTRARQAVQDEAPRQEPSEGLRQMVAAAQKEDPFYKRVEKELAAQAQAKSTLDAG